MLTFDARTREVETFGALKIMVETMGAKQFPLPDLFRSTETLPGFEQPKVYICIERNAIFMYFKQACKTTKLGERTDSFVTDCVIAYDFDKDNDDGDSFNKTLQKYGIEWKDVYWYGAFEEAVQLIRQGKNLSAWVAPAKPDYLGNSGMKQSSDFDLDAFLNGIPAPVGVRDDDEGDYCPFCGELLENCECDEDDKDDLVEEYCRYCGQELDDDGDCPDCSIKDNDDDIPEDEFDEDFDDEDM